MNLTESIEGSELDHRLDLFLEQHRQDDDVERRGLPQSRADKHIIVWDTGQHDAFLLQHALSDQSLSGPELIREVLAIRVSITAEQPHQRLAFSLGLID